MAPWLQHLATRPVFNGDLFTIRAFGYRMNIKEAARLAVLRVVCAHKRLQFFSATVARPADGCNVEVGVVVRCPDCRRAWFGDVVAGMSDNPLPRRFG